MKTITAVDFLALSDREKRVVDVRSSDEFCFEHIAGSVNVPLERISEELPNARADEKVYVICQSGLRSAAACEQLQNSGFHGAITVLGGISAVKKAGGLVIRSGVPLPLMRQVQMTAGALVLLGVVLAFLFGPKWTLISAFVGAGLVFAGVTGTCGMAILLSKMPWNKRGGRCPMP